MGANRQDAHSANTAEMRGVYTIARGDRVSGRDIDGVTRSGVVTFATNHHLVLDGAYTVPRERAAGA